MDDCRWWTVARNVSVLLGFCARDCPGVGKDG